MSRDINDAIDAWHALPSPPPCPLHEWLGMTWEEYRAWAENPAAVLPTRRPADVPPMARRARRAFRRALPTCRAVHADGGACRRARSRAYIPGEHVPRRGDARIIIAAAAAFGWRP